MNKHMQIFPIMICLALIVFLSLPLAACSDVNVLTGRWQCFQVNIGATFYEKDSEMVKSRWFEFYEDDTWKNSYGNEGTYTYDKKGGPITLKDEYGEMEDYYVRLLDGMLVVQVSGNGVTVSKYRKA
jgi:hypothetical protein